VLHFLQKLCLSIRNSPAAYNSDQFQTVSDLIGVCKSSSEVQTLIARNTNRELKKREVTLVDQSNTSVSKLFR
jgi:hypothetical protein